MKNFINILKQETPFLDAVQNRLLHIGFLSVFTAIFLSVYSPFNMKEWGGDIFGYILIGTSVLFSVQFLLRWLLGWESLKFYQILLLAFIEFSLTTLLLYLIYGENFVSLEGKLVEILVTLKFVSLIVLGPYGLSLWFLAGRQKPYTVNIEKKAKEILSIKSEHDKVLFAIKYDKILYAKSSGNYVEIHYLKGVDCSMTLVRMSLKELESKIADPAIIRIHRSYLVNKNMISSFSKTRKGYELVMLHNSQELLPVSSGFKESFESGL